MKKHEYRVIALLIALFCLTLAVVQFSPWKSMELNTTTNAVANTAETGEPLEEIKEEYPPKASFGPEELEPELDGDSSVVEGAEEEQQMEDADTSAEASISAIEMTNTPAEAEDETPEQPTDAKTEALENADEMDSTVTENQQTPEQSDAPQSMRTLTVKERDYIVTASVPAEAKLSEQTELQVKEIAQGSKQYEDLLLEVQDQVQQKEDTVQTADSVTVIDTFRLIDISFVVNGEEVEPEAPVQVEIQYREKELTDSKDVSVLHFDEKTGVERPRNQTVSSDRTGNVKAVFKS